MAATYNFLKKGVEVILENGNNTQVKLINYTFSDDDYDDVTIQTITGSSWVSGLIFPVRGTQGSNEAMLLEQGKIKTTDKMLYLSGSIVLNSSGLLLGIGSPTSTFYSVIPDGIHTYEVNGSNVYHKLILRHTVPGSLY